MLGAMRGPSRDFRTYYNGLEKHRTWFDGGRDPGEPSPPKTWKDHVLARIPGVVILMAAFRAPLWLVIPSTVALGVWLAVDLVRWVRRRLAASS
jgi:hypothetical protein